MHPTVRRRQADAVLKNRASGDAAGTCPPYVTGRPPPSIIVVGAGTGWRNGNKLCVTGITKTVEEVKLRVRPDHKTQSRQISQ
jgi:hypothetical protein